MIKAVGQAIPIYVMGVFHIPPKLYQEMEIVLNKFYWNHGHGSRGLNWMKWKRMTPHKDEGGLGFRELSTFNLAMLAKQGWRLLANETSLCSQVFRAKYFPNTSVMEAKSNQANASYIWTSLMKERQILEMGCGWRLGDGTKVRIWKDPWIPGNIAFKPSSFPRCLSADTTVNFLFVLGKREWNCQLLQHMFTQEDAASIQKIVLPYRNEADALIWHFEGTGIYTVKSGYKAFVNNNSTTSRDMRQSGLFKQIWNTRVLNKHKSFMWRFTQDCLPTRTNLHHCGIVDDVHCPICGQQPETTIHIFGIVWWLHKSGGIAVSHKCFSPLLLQ